MQEYLSGSVAVYIDTKFVNDEYIFITHRRETHIDIQTRIQTHIIWTSRAHRT